MAEVSLYKKLVTYPSKVKDEKTGVEKEVEKTATNFYVKCGDMFVPVELKYFGTKENPDKNYGARKSVMSAFAEDLPEKPAK